MHTQNISNFISVIEGSLSKLDLDPKFEQVGEVLSVADGVIKISGLTKAMMGEVVKFPSGAEAVILNIEESSLSAMILGDSSSIKEGDIVKKAEKELTVKVGMNTLGRVLNGLGNPIDGIGEIHSDKISKIERKAPGIIERKSVHEPLVTGIKVIDSLIPIGRGQRELIIGDRKTGKTSIAIDAILNQAKLNENLPDNQKVFCVYVSIGQKASSVAKLAEQLKKTGAMKYTCIVAANASDSASMQFLSPYTGCAIAEFFRDNGMHSLIVYDDLSKHAVAYREVSLLLRRPPGREAYPADVFYLHSRLLERAAKMSDKNGSGSLTALPIIETQAGDVSAYIPTNVISITDGQIFLESELFYKGIKPAVNIGLSVSRVGSAAQLKATKQVSGKLKLDLAQFRELESFAQFGSDLDDSTKLTISRGQKLTSLLKQDVNHPLSMPEQVCLLYCASSGLIDKIELNSMKHFERDLLKNLSDEKWIDIARDILEKSAISSENEKRLIELIDFTILHTNENNHI